MIRIEGIPIVARRLAEARGSKSGTNRNNIRRIKARRPRARRSTRQTITKVA